MSSTTAGTELPSLLPRHREQLVAGSGIAPDVVAERGAYSVLSSGDVRALGFSERQSRMVPGLVLPVHAPDGTNGLAVLRPDTPPIDADGNRLKYLLPRNATPRLDVPPRCRPMLADPSIDVYITEGQKKGDALASHGLCAVVLLGVWLFKGRNRFGAPVLLADFDLIAWKGRRAFIVFDSDVMLKGPVQKALERLAAHLTRMGAKVVPIYLPDDGQDGKVGVDDYLLTHALEELRGLVGTRPSAPAPTVELLHEPPLRLARPLSIVQGRAYAATWLWTQTTTTAALDADGKIAVLETPRVERKRELFIVRDDGLMFGPGAARTLAALQLEDGIEYVELDTDFVRDSQCWRAAAVERYRGGDRPDPAGVFRRLAGLFDHFMSFERSVVTQDAMCELSAVLTLMTWWLGSFDVLPYPWPNGDKGSGKSTWGMLWALTSNLGEMISAASTFAALRDHAAFGGALVVDDAETLADPKRSDPNVRALLLSGNRRGTVVALKELVGKLWQTRYVDSFAPRAFTAIRLPDDVLQSRSIVIPLVRSADPIRQRRDPARVERWPCDRSSLLDDLWALALSLLVEARNVWDELDDDHTVADGRLYDCWRAPLAVARLLERHGVAGLESRIRDVMAAYVAERHQTPDDDDRMVILVRALLVRVHQQSALGDVCDVDDVDDVSRETPIVVKASEVPDLIRRVVDDDTPTDWATSRAIGWMLRRLRVRKAQRLGTRRGWELRRSEITTIAASYGIRQPGTSDTFDTPTVPSHDPNVTNVINVTNVTSSADDGAEIVDVEIPYDDAE